MGRHAGYKHSMETRKKMGRAGVLHYDWNGAILLIRQRERIRARDGHLCLLCGGPNTSVGQALHTHHIDGSSECDDNRATLCANCHLGRARNKNQRLLAKEELTFLVAAGYEPGLWPMGDMRGGD